MKRTCSNEQEALKAVLDKYFSGQQTIFDRVLAQSVYARPDCFEVTIYMSDIFKETSLVTYIVDRRTGTIDRSAVMGL